MRQSQRLMGMAGVLALLAAPAAAAAASPAPLRASAALPTIGNAPDGAPVRRAAAPVAHASGLGPFSLLGAIIGLTLTTVVVVVVASHGHSPG